MAVLNFNELRHMLALQHIPKLTDRLKKQLVIAFGSAEQIFARDDTVLSTEQEVLLKIIDKNNTAQLFDEVDTELLEMERHNIKAVAFNQRDYPNLLTHCFDSPLLLFYRGNIDLNKKRIISIVGTRKMTLYGKEFCENLVRELAPFNPIIVSGLAYGVDITAHKAAIRNGLQTIACLAHGLHTLYPTRHSVYQNEIEQNGGFMTEFWTNQPFNKVHFLQRNRIIAGMSKATIVVESAKKGGSLVTADIAFSYDRDLFAVPGRTFDRQSRGCIDLIKYNKAQMLTSASDIVKALNWDDDLAPKKRQMELFVSLSKTEQQLYDILLNNERMHLDELSIEAQMPTREVASNLLRLELKNLIRPLPGKQFMAS